MSPMERPEESPVDQRACPFRVRAGEPVERLGQPVAALAEQPGDLPVPVERAGQVRTAAPPFLGRHRGDHGRRGHGRHGRPVPRLVRLRRVVVEFERVLERRPQVRVRLAQLVVAVHLVVVGEVAAEVPCLGQVPRDVPLPAGGRAHRTPRAARRRTPAACRASGTARPRGDHGLVDEADSALTTSGRSSDTSAHTSSAAARLNVPAKTESRAHSRRSAASTARGTTRSRCAASGAWAARPAGLPAAGQHREPAVEPPDELGAAAARAAAPRPVRSPAVCRRACGTAG